MKLNWKVVLNFNFSTFSLRKDRLQMIKESVIKTMRGK